MNLSVTLSSGRTSDLQVFKDCLVQQKATIPKIQKKLTVLFFPFPIAGPIYNIQRFWEIYSIPLQIHMTTTMAFTAMCMY
jgi:hypothetical protein